MFILQHDPIDPVKLRNTSNKGASGAFVNFEGIVRQDQSPDGHPTCTLEYVADIAGCNHEGSGIVREACHLFSITQAMCVQRIGKVPVTETAIWIGVWSSHRDDAFKGCRYIIEEIKKRLLIWKKEYYSNGTSRWIRGNQTPVIH